jgi:hypothetical protein
MFQPAIHFLCSQVVWWDFLLFSSFEESRNRGSGSGLCIGKGVVYEVTFSLLARRSIRHCNKERAHQLQLRPLGSSGSLLY